MIQRLLITIVYIRVSMKEREDQLIDIASNVRERRERERERCGVHYGMRDRQGEYMHLESWIRPISGQRTRELLVSHRRPSSGINRGSDRGRKNRRAKEEETVRSIK